MRGLPRERWLGFQTWLDSGVSGIHPQTVRRTLGPIAALLPLARQVARSVSPWLLFVLAERQRLGLDQPAPNDQDGAETLQNDCRQQPCRRWEAQRSPRWLGWQIGAEAQRLVRLAEAPEARMLRLEWVAWEVRYWALAVSLARMGQLYAALEQRQGRDDATETLIDALDLAWSQATRARSAA